MDIDGVVDSCPGFGSTCLSLPYKPHLGGNIFFLIAFTTLFALQVFKGCTHRIHGYSAGISIALICECLGYAGKVMYSHNSNNTQMAGYLLYIIFLSIGPNFIAAVNYISLSRFVWALGRRYSRVHPAVYSWGFILADIICTLVLGAGASWAALLAPVQMGERLMIGGLAGQAFCSLLFATLGLDYYLRRRRMIRVSPEEDQDGAEYLWYLGRAKICAFAYVTAISSVCLLTRACFRIVELSGGFNGTLARIEPLLFALDGVPVLIASTACTLVTPHPDFWHASRIAQQERPIQDHLPLKATYNLDQGL